MLVSKLALVAVLAINTVSAVEQTVHLRVSVQRETAGSKDSALATICPSNSTAVSVQGREGSFCAQNPVCGGTTSDKGNCPDAQDGLWFGSYCGNVGTDSNVVYGCMLYVQPPHHRSQRPSPVPAFSEGIVCMPGFTAVAAEGWEQVFCAKNDVCGGSESDKGNCPEAQDGLTFGSYCGNIATNGSTTYGCMTGFQALHHRRTQTPTTARKGAY